MPRVIKIIHKKRKSSYRNDNYMRTGGGFFYNKVCRCCKLFVNNFTKIVCIGGILLLILLPKKDGFLIQKNNNNYYYHRIQSIKQQQQQQNIFRNARRFPPTLKILKSNFNFISSSSKPPPPPPPPPSSNSLQKKYNNNIIINEIQHQHQHQNQKEKDCFWIYNSAINKKELFQSVSKNNNNTIKMYTCGPTVYDYAHIGNFRAFITYDLLKRWLLFIGYQVHHVCNLTDIDDKIIKKVLQLQEQEVQVQVQKQKQNVKNVSKTNNSSSRSVSSTSSSSSNSNDSDNQNQHQHQMENLKKITNFYASQFFSDLKKLNILPATDYPRATEHITDIVDMIKELMQSGFAYQSSTKSKSIYFNVSKFPRYGTFREASKNDHTSISRIGEENENENEEKQNPNDWVLWKTHNPDHDGDIYWDTDIGRGRPGWHIECSCMARKKFGFLNSTSNTNSNGRIQNNETIDIHCGGMDLKFPHHENEIAQSEALFNNNNNNNNKFVNYWIHNGFVTVNNNKINNTVNNNNNNNKTVNKKMSKSSKNFITIQDLLSKKDGHLNIRAYRYLVISSNYRHPLQFNDEILQSAKNTLKRLDKFYFIIFNNNEKYSTTGTTTPTTTTIIKGDNNNNNNWKEVVLSNTTNTVVDIQEIQEKVRKSIENFKKALSNDLNTAIAITYLFDVIKLGEKSIVKFLLKTNNNNNNNNELSKKMLILIPIFQNALIIFNNILGIFYTNTDEKNSNDNNNIIDDEEKKNQFFIKNITKTTTNPPSKQTNVITTKTKNQQKILDKRKDDDDNDKIPPIVLDLIQSRIKAKKMKNYPLADHLRKDIQHIHGYFIHDMKNENETKIIKISI